MVELTLKVHFWYTCDTKSIKPTLWIVYQFTAAHILSQTNVHSHIHSEWELNLRCMHLEAKQVKHSLTNTKLWKCNLTLRASH